MNKKTKSHLISKYKMLRWRALALSPRQRGWREIYADGSTLGSGTTPREKRPVHATKCCVKLYVKTVRFGRTSNTYLYQTYLVGLDGDQLDRLRRREQPLHSGDVIVVGLPLRKRRLQNFWEVDRFELSAFENDEDSTRFSEEIRGWCWERMCMAESVNISTSPFTMLSLDSAWIRGIFLSTPGARNYKEDPTQTKTPGFPV